MNLNVIKGKTLFKIIVGIEIVLLVMILSFIKNNYSTNTVKMVMGGVFQYQFTHKETKEVYSKEWPIDQEKYFRPSKLAIINNRIKDFSFYIEFQGKKPNEIKVPDNLLKTPEDTVINYFSVLREGAGSFEEGKWAGCGTLGNATTPYPIAYNFLITDYKEKLTYENYLCAPYHGWAYMAESVVDIKFGEWCSLVKERQPTEQEGYVKKFPLKEPMVVIIL
ncbi:hypothetical protein [Clostridium sp.]|uniref:hypothetical protein n=1 Tax=Clostridium sp. TaxID=1506 RepID=UPI002FC5F9D5